MKYMESMLLKGGIGVVIGIIISLFIIGVVDYIQSGIIQMSLQEESIKASQSELEFVKTKLQRLEDYLGVVEWTEKKHKLCACGYGTKDVEKHIKECDKFLNECNSEIETYYTKDPLRVEWVKKECGVIGKCPADGNCYAVPEKNPIRCQELKTKLGL